MNVVMFITDQERAIQHFPLGWSEQNLPGLTQLQRHGVTFENAFTNACMCSPARSTLMSGYFPAQHGVKYTLESNMQPPTYPQVPLPTPSTLANIATVMSAAGYNVDLQGQVALQQARRRHLEPRRTCPRTGSRAGTRTTPAPTRASPRWAAASPTTTAAS